MKISLMTQWCRRLVSVGASALLLAALGVMPAHAVLSDGFFALDSNTADPNGAATDDWESFASGGTANTTKATGIVADSDPPKVFRNGSKDTQDISAWRYDLGSSPPKDDMLHAYAAAYKATTPRGATAVDDLLIYFGADRAAFSGTASLGFWFFKTPIKAENGSFVVAGTGTSTPATHTDGDTLVAFEYTNGGAVTDVRIFKWVGGASGVLTPHALISLGATTTSGVFCDSPTADLVCGATNAGNLALPWNGTVKPGQFFEGGINITQLVGGDGCFASFMATSRSSSVEGAALKNFILSPGFQTCRIGISVTKACDLDLVAQTVGGVTQLGVKVNFSGTVTNDSQVALTNVYVCEKHEGSSTCNYSSDPVTLAAGASANYSGSYMPSLALNTATPPISVSTRPEQAVFKDTAQAFGTLPAIIGGTISSSVVEQSCTLCVNTAP